MLVTIILLTIVVALLVWHSVVASGARGYTKEDAPWKPPEIQQNLLTPTECEYLIQKSEPLFTRSGVVGSSVPDEARTSDTAWIDKNDPVARKLVEKAMQLTGKPFENCESLQVVRYRPGTYYRSHHDSCCDDTEGCKIFEKTGGQRVGTLLVYLNSEFTEGETHFPSYNDMKIKPSPGSAVFFRPMDEQEGKCHPKALHAGLPIKEGTKYVCNVWVREEKI